MLKILINNKMEKRNLRKEIIGVVSSNKMDKTILVVVERKMRHPRYLKMVKKSSKFFADDPKNDCNIGDTVRLMETRPLSKNKCWRLVEIIERAK
jgi:small subunit ribosomal protein S17